MDAVVFIGDAGLHRVEIKKDGNLMKTITTKRNGLIRTQLSAGYYDFICLDKPGLSIKNKAIGTRTCHAHEFGIIYNESGSDGSDS